MKKYLYALVVVCLLAVALVGCKAPADTPGEGGVTKVKLASHNAVIEGNAYRVRYEQDIQDAAKAAMDSGMDVSYASFVSNWDAATESQQLENSINEGYDVILVNPVAPTGLDPIIEKALDEDIIYINCDCEYYADNILNVATDQDYLGYQTATYAGEILGKGGKVVMIAAIAGNAANEWRQEGFERGIAEQGLEVVGYYNHDWNMVQAREIMAEILNSGLEFDGVLVSQGAISIMQAYEAADAPWPKFVGFGDDGQYMQRMLELNADETVLPYIVVSNPPGVGASGLNFALNMLMGKELKEGIYDRPEYNSIYLKSKIWFTDKNQDEHADMVNAMDPNDVISYWLTIDEVAAEYFK